MSLRKKSSENILFHIPNADLSKNIKNSSNEHHVLISKLIDSTNELDQINLLKEIGQSLREKQLLNKHDIITVEVLAHFYHQIPMKSSAKKSLIRIIQELSIVHSDLVVAILKNTLCSYISHTTHNSWMEQAQSSATRILSLLESLTIGKDVIDLCHRFIWKHLSECIVKTTEAIRTEISPQKRIELFSLSQILLKVLAVILQQCKISFVSLNNSDENFKLQTSQIWNTVQELLTHDSTLLNCRLNAAIVFCLYFHMKDSHLFKKYLFSDEFSKACGNFPAAAQLCLFSGMMAVLPVSDIVVETEEESVSNKIVSGIFHILNSTDDSEIMLLCARTLLHWTNIMCQALRSKECSEKFRNSFAENGNAIKILFQYVLNNREHFIDSMRYLTKDVFKNAIKLHLMASNLEAHQSKEVKDLALHLFEKIPFHSSGKYGLMSCLTEELKTDVVIAWRPSLPEELLRALLECSLVPHVVEFYQVLIKNSVQNGDDSSFQELWIRPLLNCLCFGTTEQIVAITDHILPKLLALKPSSAHFVINELSVMTKTKTGHCFSALMKCEKFYHEHFYKENKSFASFSILENALIHADEQVRLSAFSLLCESRKTVEPISSEILTIIKYSLPHNMNNQCPSFRQQLVAYMKKLLTRLNDSSYATEKKTFKDNAQTHHLAEHYKEFLLWLTNFLLSCLHPGANFPRRITALNMLSVLHTIFSKNHIIENFAVPVNDRSSALTLLYTLRDTYESNKQSVLDILSDVPPSLLNFQNETFVLQLLKTALILASSTKPPDSATASYVFALLVRFAVTSDVAMPYLLEEYQQEVVLLGISHLPAADKLQSTYMVVLVLLCDLMRQRRMAQDNLLQAAVNGPMYGVLTCIRNVISQMKFGCMTDDKEARQWQNLFCKLLTLSTECADTVEPIVCNSSPEGHLPMDTDSDSVAQLQSAVRRAIGCRFQSAVVETGAGEVPCNAVKLDLAKTHAVTAQMLLLCCWRTHKEVSLLFGEMAVSRAGGILLDEQLMDMGQYFMRQLQLVKHRGAFEQAYVGFSKLCHTLWRSSSPDLFKLPQTWLNDLIATIKGNNSSGSLCSTRRSAGLPFIIQALLVTGPEKSTCCKETLTNLLSLSEYSAPKNGPDSRVHALHILRALFRDASLREDVMPFVSKGLKVSILGFKSDLWAVRNASTLLFSALMTRVFGVNQFQGDAGKKNRLTGKVFFMRFKDLHSFLHDELKCCTESPNLPDKRVSIKPTLYPILLILGRLYSLPGECDPLLEAFAPLLRICGSSPIWKTRALAAQALVPLLSPESLGVALYSLFQAPDAWICQNEVHGKLLQILNILKELSHSSLALKKPIHEKLKTWLCKHLNLGLSINSCYTTRVAFLEILYFALSTTGFILDIMQLTAYRDDFMKELETVFTSPDKERFLSIATSLFLLHLCQLDDKDITLLFSSSTAHPSCASHIENTFIHLLSSTHYEVRFVALKFLVKILNRNDEDLIDQDDSVLLEDILDASALESTSINSAFRSGLLESEVLSEFFVSMIMNGEKHSACIGKVYQLLCLIPKSISINWKMPGDTTSLQDIEKLDWVLLQFKKCNRDEISNPMFMYLAHLALHVYKRSCQNEKSSEKLSTDTSMCSETLREWSAEVVNSTLSNQSFSRRYYSVAVLRLVSDPLLQAESKHLGAGASLLWQALFFTLIDDEPDIKRLASEIVVHLQSDNVLLTGAVNFPVVPTFAVGVMMDLFVEQFGQKSPSECFAMLLSWMLTGDADSYSDVVDEQPFDKGEMNIFAEDLAITGIASKRLSRFLGAQEHPQDLEVSTDKISRWKNTQRRFCSLDDVVSMCLTDANAIVDKMLMQNSTLPFLSHCLDQQLVVLCQCIWVAAELWKWSVKSDDFKLLLKRLRGNAMKLPYRTKFLNDLVFQIENFNEF